MKLEIIIFNRPFLYPNRLRPPSSLITCAGQERFAYFLPFGQTKPFWTRCLGRSDSLSGWGVSSYFPLWPNEAILDAVSRTLMGRAQSDSSSPASLPLAHGEQASGREFGAPLACNCRTWCSSPGVTEAASPWPRRKGASTGNFAALRSAILRCRRSQLISTRIRRLGPNAAARGPTRSQKAKRGCSGTGAQYSDAQNGSFPNSQIRYG
jgi:hypothetical protein